MKAAVLEKLNSSLVIEELEIPRLDFGQALVKVMTSGICGKQLGEISGHYGEDKYLPHLLGHEGGGIVVDIGQGVKQVKEGDHVVMHWRKGTGAESKFPIYRRKGGGIVGAGLVTTFNEYAIVSENRLTPVDKDIPFEIAALMGCAVTTGLGIINNEAKLKIGQSIAVFGCGGVGLNIIQGASLVSAYPIIAIDKINNKLGMAVFNGATFGINSEEDNVKDEVFKIVGKAGVDVFVDCTGNTDVISQIFDMTAYDGKIILVGQPKCDASLIVKSIANHYGGKKIFASQGGLTNPNTDIPRYLRLYTEGKLNLNHIITHRFKLQDINIALGRMLLGETGRCIINMER